jgi:hypothetical protein
MESSTDLQILLSYDGHYATPTIQTAIATWQKNQSVQHKAIWDLDGNGGNQ